MLFALGAMDYRRTGRLLTEGRSKLAGRKPRSPNGTRHIHTSHPSGASEHPRHPKPYPTSANVAGMFPMPFAFGLHILGTDSSLWIRIQTIFGTSSAGNAGHQLFSGIPH